MIRMDLFTYIHKGLRRVLFETALKVSETDFSAGGEDVLAGQAILRMLGFIEDHAMHEDSIIFPALNSVAPELLEEIQAEHIGLEALQRELRRLVAQLRTATELESLAIGKQLNESMCRLVALQVAHMVREEAEVNPVLWAHYSDAEIQLMRERIFDRTSEKRLMEWYALALPAMNALERRALLSGLHATMTLEQFERITAAARAELGERRWLAALTT